MGKTNKTKEAQRKAHLRALPKSQRSVKLAMIKKKEGRILNATEKHALAMSSTPGKILKAWDAIRSGTNGSLDTAPIDAETRAKQIDDLLHMLFENWPAYVRTPKVSRVIQSCIKHGTNDHHAKILAKMLVAVADYASDSFSHHVFLALLRHTKSREIFDDLLAGVIPVAAQIAATKFGFSVLSSCYGCKFATQEHRNFIVTHASVPNSTVAALQATQGYPDLEKMLAADTTSSLLLRTRVLLGKIVDKMLASAATATGSGSSAAAANAAQQQANKLGADLLETALAQRFVRVYLTSVCSGEDIGDSAGTMCQVLGAEGAVANALLHALLVQCQTKDGCEACSISFAVAAPALRRSVLRQIASNFADIAPSKFGAPFLARVLDFAYDPQLASKFIVAPAVAAVGELLATSPYAHQLVLHALTPSLERKRRALLPVFLGLNLYSRENATAWAQFRTADKTVVQCCDVKQHPAERSHAFFLAGVLPAIAQWAAEAKQPVVYKTKNKNKNKKKNKNDEKKPAGNDVDGKDEDDSDDDDVQEDGSAAVAQQATSEDAGGSNMMTSHARLAICRIAKELHHLEETKDPLLAAIISGMEDGDQSVLAKFKEFVPKNVFRDENGFTKKAQAPSGAAAASSVTAATATSGTSVTAGARRQRSASAAATAAPVPPAAKAAAVPQRKQQPQQQQAQKTKKQAPPAAAPVSAPVASADDDAPRVKSARQKPMLR